MNFAPAPQPRPDPLATVAMRDPLNGSTGMQDPLDFDPGEMGRTPTSLWDAIATPSGVGFGIMRDQNQEPGMRVAGGLLGAGAFALGMVNPATPLLALLATAHNVYRWANDPMDPLNWPANPWTDPDRIDPGPGFNLGVQTSPVQEQAWWTDLDPNQSTGGGWGGNFSSGEDFGTESADGSNYA